MANKTNTKKKTKAKNKSNSLLMKLLVILGVILLCISLIYLMDYFFVKKSNLKINMSTEKKLEYLTINGKQELIATQKYVSDLDYTMRYDIESFKVFKYKNQDIYRYLKDEKVVVAVEKSSLSGNCSASTLDNVYNSCYVKRDSFTEEYYFSRGSRVYKITVKVSDDHYNKSSITPEIYYMLNSFIVTD